jgi:hypothetical protein
VGCTPHRYWSFDRKTGQTEAKQRTKHAGVYVCDMSNDGRIVDEVGEDKNGYYALSDRERNHANLRYLKGQEASKTDAIKRAKWWAQEHNLPFHPQEDVVDIGLLRSGPIVACLICAEVRTRSFGMFVCKDCRDNAERGRLAITEGELAMVHTGSLVPYAGYTNLARGRDEELTLGRLLLQIAGVVSISKPKDESWKNAPVIRIEKPTENRAPRLWFYAKPDVIYAMGELVKLIKQFIESAKDDGVKKGSNMLERLMDGTMPVTVFDKGREQ